MMMMILSLMKRMMCVRVTTMRKFVVRPWHRVRWLLSAFFVGWEREEYQKCDQEERVLACTRVGTVNDIVAETDQVQLLASVLPVFAVVEKETGLKEMQKRKKKKQFPSSSQKENTKTKKKQTNPLWKDWSWRRMKKWQREEEEEEQLEAMQMQKKKMKPKQKKMKMKSL